EKPFPVTGIWRLSSLEINLTRNRDVSVRAVLTSPGEDITLRCWLEPGVAADDMYVQWIKYESGETVHLYTRGRERPDLQDEAYRGRTELSRGALTRGIISLRLKNVRCSDQGHYTCSARSATSEDETTVSLKVEGQLHITCVFPYSRLPFPVCAHPRTFQPRTPTAISTTAPTLMGCRCCSQWGRFLPLPRTAVGSVKVASI
uniref:Ig-like domain-containing protein n=1 Tax=Callorhinchus milii TaxID=7868 RepID=A0A4W3H1E6_CALMI